jgi:class 3 adenylate cyclase
MDEPRVRYATTSDGVRIAYASIGSGPAFVGMMPFPFTNLEAAWQLPEIRAWHVRLGRGRQLVVYDGRGTGLSDRDYRTLTLDTVVDDLSAVVDQVGLARFALMSSPTAGPIAIAYAARRPERVSHLILGNTFARGADGLPPQVERLLRLADEDWELYTETIAHTMIGWSEGSYAHRFARFLRACASAEVNRAYVDLLRTTDVTALLPAIAAPTCVIHRRDVAWPSVDVARAMTARIPDARLVLLDGASTAPFIGDMEAYAAAIDEFVGDVPASAPPAQTPLAILVTDVVGSTALTERLGDAGARTALRRHEQVVRQALAAYGGTEVKTMGDGFIASFVSVSRALECAIAIQREEARTASGIRIRMGLNVGEPIAEAGDLFGTAIIVASRLAQMAAGDEIVASDVVRQLAAGKDFRFDDRGEVTIRGFSAPLHAWLVRWSAD